MAVENLVTCPLRILSDQGEEADTLFSDSFVGGYAAEYLRSKLTGTWDIRSAVQKGCKASARVIEHIGCLEPICWADEIDIPASPRGSET